MSNDPDLVDSTQRRPFPRPAEAGTTWACIGCNWFVPLSTVQPWGERSSWWGAEPSGDCHRCGIVDVREVIR